MDEKGVDGGRWWRNEEVDEKGVDEWLEDKERGQERGEREKMGAWERGKL